MIELVLTFCLLSSGECSSLAAVRQYEAAASCEARGAVVAGEVEDDREALAGLGLRFGGWTCRG